MRRAPGLRSLPAVSGYRRGVVTYHAEPGGQPGDPSRKVRTVTMLAKRKPNGVSLLSITCDDELDLEVSSQLAALGALATVEWYVDEEHTAIDGNALASGNDAEDEACYAQLRARLNRGDQWAWFGARVVAKLGDHEGIGICGCNSYESEADWLRHGYPDLRDEALRDLARQLGLEIAGQSSSRRRGLRRLCDCMIDGCSIPHASCVVCKGSGVVS